MANVVLDASALVAYLKQEPGGESVGYRLPGAMLCSVNLAEALAILMRDGMNIAAAQNAIAHTQVRLVEFDASLAEKTAVLVGHARRKGLSLADCACLALAEREKLPALTADRGWRDLDVGVEIQFIR